MYGMKEVCRKVGMNYSTLKFYCNEGLIPNVKRDNNNHRIFDNDDIEWIKSLTCLKNCNMSLDEMKKFLALCLEGEKTIPERKIMLSKKKSSLQEKIASIEEAIDYIDWKQNFYDEILRGANKIKK